MHKTTRLKLLDVNPHLLCVLCGGYFIEATAIIECLHSFCRSCITKYLEGSKCCPICDVQVHKTKPLLNLRPDKTLQTLVYKLIPGLYQQEMQRRREFYKEHPHAAPSPSAPNASEEKGEVNPDRYNIVEKQENISLILQNCYRLPLIPAPSTSKKHKRSKNETASTNQTDRRFLLCPAGVSVGHLKKFIRCKFDIPEDHQIEMFYHGDETLPEDYTVADVAYVYGWTRRQPLHINYMVLDTNEVCLRLPTPNASCPIVVKETAHNNMSDPEPSEHHEASPNRPSEVANPHDDSDAELLDPPEESQNLIDNDSLISSQISVSDSGKRHGHKKKKKKKKHKRSRSKEEPELTEEQRSVIKVRIPKNKLFQSGMSWDMQKDSMSDVPNPTIPSFKFQPAEESSQSDSDLTNIIGLSNKTTIELKHDSEKTEVCDKDNNNSNILKPLDKVEENKIISQFPFTSFTSDTTTVSEIPLASSAYISLKNPKEQDINDSSLCISSDSDEEMSEVDTANDENHNHSADITNTSEFSLIDESNDSTLETKEYTCELSKDGKVVFHSSKSSKWDKNNVLSLDIVVEETPPEIIVVDKDIEDLDQTKMSYSNGPQNTSIDNCDKNDSMQDYNKNDQSMWNKQSKLNVNLELKNQEQCVEEDKPVLIPVDESGTIVGIPEPKDSLAKCTNTSGYVKSSSPREADTASDTDQSQSMLEVVASSTTPACSNAKNGLDGATLASTKIHSSLSPPGIRKRPKTTESDKSPKQARLCGKNSFPITCTAGSGTVTVSAVSAHQGMSSNISSTPSLKVNGKSGVHSSLSPPSLNGKSNGTKPSQGTVDAHGGRGSGGPQGVSDRVGNISLQLPSRTPNFPFSVGNFIPQLNYSSSHFAAHMSDSIEMSVTKKSSKRGPLKERPVTLPVSTPTTSKPAYTIPKPQVYSSIHKYAPYQQHIHPSLSAISVMQGHFPSSHAPAAMKQLRLLCGEMGRPVAQVASHALQQPYALQTAPYLPNSRHFLSPIFSPVPPRSIPSPLSPTRASPLSPNHFGPLSPAHFGPLSPPRLSPPGLPSLSLGAHYQVPGYDCPLELTTRRTQDRQRDVRDRTLPGSSSAAPCKVAPEKT